MKTAAKLKEMTAVNKEGVLVLSPGVCRIAGLARFTDKPLFPRAKKNRIGPRSHTVAFAIYLPLCELRNAWADSMFT